MDDVLFVLRGHDDGHARAGEDFLVEAPLHGEARSEEARARQAERLRRVARRFDDADQGKARLPAHVVEHDVRGIGRHERQRRARPFEHVELSDENSRQAREIIGLDQADDRRPGTPRSSAGNSRPSIPARCPRGCRSSS